MLIFSHIFFIALKKKKIYFYFKTIVCFFSRLLCFKIQALVIIELQIFFLKITIYNVLCLLNRIKLNFYIYLETSFTTIFKIILFIDSIILT